MHFASDYTYLAKKQAPKKKKKEKKDKKKEEAVLQQSQSISLSDESNSMDEQLNLNVFVVTFQGVKQAEKQLAGGDPYNCKHCGAILNKHSKVLWQQDLIKAQPLKKLQLGKFQALWQCQFCSHSNTLKVEREQVPLKDDIVYMLESEHMGVKNQNDSTIVFCIDTSGSMNSTTAVEGKVDLKFGLSQEEIDMLKQFMEPGDQAQFNQLPGLQNQNKTFVSRKQCILSAIESQIKQIKNTYPLKKIGFVTFGSEVVALGDTKSQTVHIVGDKLYKKESIIDSLINFRLQDPVVEAEKVLLNSINKIDANGQTALGPALITALDIAQKGSPGSTVILCTDGLANIGIGQLEPYDQIKKKFYQDLGERAKQKNVTVNIVTIKGEGCKVEAIGQLAQKTNGNIKIVNPQKLSQDFANVLKDEVVGLNVAVRILLHKGMRFRNEAVENIKEEGCLLQKVIANATKNTRVSFEYDLKKDEELQQLKIDLASLKTVPFQAQIQYTSPTGGKFLRVISSVCNTTQSKQEMSKKANLGVVHHRITNQTAAMYRGGNYEESKGFNDKWANYLGNNFKEKKFQVHQNKFMEKNQRLNKAIRHRHRKSIEKKHEKMQDLMQHQQQIMNAHSDIESDEDQRELVDNLMERQCYSIVKGKLSSGSSGSKSPKSILSGKSIESDKKVSRKSSLKRRKSVPKKEKKESSKVQKKKIGRKASVEQYDSDRSY